MLDFITDVYGSICQIIVELGLTCWNLYFGIVGWIGDTDLLVNDFTSLFGNSTVYNTIQGIYEGAVIPVGESILALFMLVQLVKISQRIDATATLPAVKDIVFLVVTYVLLHWFITHSLEVMTAIYDIFNNIAISIGSSSDIAASALNIDDWVKEDAELGGCWNFFQLGFMSMIIGFIGYILSLVIAYARAFQLYIMAMFSPIPMSLIGFDETRQMGIGFLKNFCAVALAGAIMVALFVLYPTICSALGTGGADSSLFDLTYTNMSAITDIGNAALGRMRIIFGWLAVSIMYIMALVKSGAWARDILGG